MGEEPAKATWRRAVLATRDPEQAKNYTQARGFHVDFSPRDVAHLDMRINGVFLPNIYFGYLQVVTAVEVRTDPSLDCYRFLMPTCSRLEAVFANDSAACGPGRGLLVSSRIKLLRGEHGNAGMNIFLDGPALRRHLTALLGKPPKDDLEFAPTIDLGQGYGQSLDRFARSAMTDLEQGALLVNPITGSLFEQFVMVGLLFAHPHNYSDKLYARSYTIASRDVRRAIDYIEANLDEPIGIAEIAAASGIPGRTLSQHFRRFYDTTPMRYLRDARLDRVREALRCAAPEESILSIAGNWGFDHMGRFAAAYRKRFGESPSETLGRHRQACGFSSPDGPCVADETWCWSGAWSGRRR